MYEPIPDPNTTTILIPDPNHISDVQIVAVQMCTCRQFDDNKQNNVMLCICFALTVTNAMAPDDTDTPSKASDVSESDHSDVDEECDDLLATYDDDDDAMDSDVCDGDAQNFITDETESPFPVLRIAQGPPDISQTERCSSTTKA